MARRVQIPEEFTSIQEAQEFWDQHSSADYEDELEDVKMELSPALKTKIELKKFSVNE